MFTAKDVMALREMSGAGMMDCKRALVETDGDMDKAMEYLREKSLAATAKKASRIAAEGIVDSYIHMGGKIGVLLEVNCETDFVAKTDDFKQLVHDIAMHIAASNPTYITKEEVDQAEIEHEKKILREQGVDEETIQKLREYDWNDFNAERRFREHQTSLLDCMELLLEEKESGESQPESVEALLDTVENEELLQILLSTDKKTLQMVVLKMMGYAPKEISHHMELPEQTVYTRLRRLREKIKKSMKFE